MASKACITTSEDRYGYILCAVDLYQPTFPRQLLTLGLMMTEQAGSGSQAPPVCSRKLGGLILFAANDSCRSNGRRHRGE